MAVGKVLLSLALLSVVEAGSPCGTVAPAAPPPPKASPCTTATQPPNTCATFACPAGFAPKGGNILCGNANDEKCCSHRCCNIVTTVTTTPAPTKAPCSTVTTTPGTTVTTTQKAPCSTVTTTPGTTVTTTPATTHSPCSTVTTTPGTTVTTTPAPTKAPCSTVTTTPGTTVTTTPATSKAPCSTVTTTPGTTVTTTPPPPTCASFTCGAGSLPKNPALVCANRKCSEEQCCAKNPCAPQNIPKPPPVKVVAPPASPCGTVAPARKYDAKEAVLAQEGAPKKEVSVVPAWAFPFFGVVAMFSFAAGFTVFRARRHNTSTRQFQIVEPTYLQEMDEEALLDAVLE